MVIYPKKGLEVYAFFNNLMFHSQEFTTFDMLVNLYERYKGHETITLPFNLTTHSIEVSHEAAIDVYLALLSCSERQSDVWHALGHELSGNDRCRLNRGIIVENREYRGVDRSSCFELAIYFSLLNRSLHIDNLPMDHKTRDLQCDLALSLKPGEYAFSNKYTDMDLLEFLLNDPRYENSREIKYELGRRMWLCPDGAPSHLNAEELFTAGLGLDDVDNLSPDELLSGYFYVKLAWLFPHFFLSHQ